MNITRTSGFTLIETLVAVTIITFSIVGPLTAANTALVAAYGARDKMTAGYLAQEAVEYVRALRDDAYYRNPGNAWNQFRSDLAQCDAGTTCRIDSVTATIAPCSGSGCAVVLDSSDRFRQGSVANSSATVFSRTMTIETVSGLEDRVVSVVSWTARGTTRSVTFTDTLKPWQ